MKRHNLIFDLDGTLVDSLPGIESALHLALKETLGEVQLPDLRHFIGPPIGMILRSIFSDLNSDVINRVEERFRWEYDEFAWKQTRLYPGVMEVLNNLRSLGIPLFVVTNKPLLPTTAILYHLKLVDLLEDWKCRDSRIPPFPSKVEVLENLIDTRDMKREQTFYIGDMPEDGDTASACQIPFIGVKSGYGNPALMTEKGFLLINSLFELLPSINSYEETL